MKRTRKWMLAGMLAALALFATACSTAAPDGSAAGSASSSQSDTQGDQTEEKTLTGTLDEVKDFMFVVTDAGGTSYEFSFDESNPVDLSGVSVGDQVTVTYTGTVSEVNPFDGTVLSVEKAE